jgi:hypothetical protein
MKHLSAEWSKSETVQIVNFITQFIWLSLFYEND